MPDNALIPEMIEQSVQIPREVGKDGHGARSDYLFATQTRGALLPAWGTRQREYTLRDYYRMDYNWAVRGAFQGIMKQIASAPWEIKGPTSGQYNVAYFQDVLRQAQFGRGWGTLIKMGVDYLRQDVGWVIEVIAPGNPMKPPTGPVTGLAHLDSLRCVPTGDPEYPMVYWDRHGVLHTLHHTRIRWLQDMPDGDERLPGYGDCALSRAIGPVWQQILMERYIQTRLDDDPPPGIVLASGMTKPMRDRAAGLYTSEQDKDSPQIWGRQMWIFGTDIGGQKPELETVTFQQTPEAWDYKQYTELNIDKLALAIGVDRQELWQLTGGNIGSAGQSQILHMKSRGNTIGDLITGLERAINDILPDEFEFQLKPRDDQASLMEATIAQTWANVVQTLGTMLTPEQARAMAANKIPAAQDAITDDAGRIERLDDLDPRSDTQLEAVATDDADVVETDGTTAAPPQRGPQTPRVSIADEVKAVAEVTSDVYSNKAIQATRLEFEATIEAIIAAALNGEIDRRRFNIILRGAINRYGLLAYRDGLVEGGVTDGTMDETDMARFTVLLAEQSQYVNNLGERLYTDGISQAQFEQKPAMWFNKTLYPFYNAGRLSAAGNANYEWVLGRTEEHCEDCLRLNGQIHRLSTYHRRGLLPKSEALSCNGFNCDCQLLRTTERARGRF